MSESQNDVEDGDEWSLDPRVEKEIEEALSDEDVVARFMGGSGDEARIPLVRDWLPGGDEWQGKTIISKREAIAHALAKNLHHAFPTIRPMEDFIIDSVNDLEMLLTSVDGRARDQQMEVLRGMFGAGKVDHEEAMTAGMTAIAGEIRKDNDG